MVRSAVGVRWRCVALVPVKGMYLPGWYHYAGGPRRPPPPQLHLRRSCDLAHASIPLAQTPLGFDWEGLAASGGTAGSHSGRPLI